MTSRWQGLPCFQDIRPGAGFRTGDFRDRKVGGATVDNSGSEKTRV